MGIGLPTGAAIVAVAAVAWLVLYRERRHDFAWPPIDWPAIVAPSLSVIVLASLLLATVIDTGSLASAQAAVVFLIAVFVLCWQLVEGPLLLIPRFQWVGLCLSMLVHAQLAMIRIVDFQSIAIALLVAFVPPEIWRVWRRRATVVLGPVVLHRARLYFLLNVVIGGTLMLLYNHGGLPIARQYVITGLLFNVSLLVMLWPIVNGLFARHRDWQWRGVPVFSPLTPRLLHLLPLALLVFGLTSHLGLRTAGNFSMFSNLRTEGDRSNHLLFADNPLKVADYQEDVVTIHAIDDEAARIGHHYHPLDGKMLPLVEFKKLLYLWQEEQRVVPVTLGYRGELISSADIAADPAWQVDRFDWEMRLLDFRLIQPDGPNRCRW